MKKDSPEVIKMKEILVDNLTYYLKRKGINQTVMARDLGFPETTVSNWIKKETYPRPDKIQMMADYFNIRRSDLTEERPTNIYEIKPEFVCIPVIGEIACGEPITAEQHIVDFTWEIKSTLPSGKLFALITKGDSMDPTITDGTMVLVRQQDDVENGEIAAVLLNGDTEATLKRIKKQGNTVMLVPDNPQYDIMIVDENNPARIIGKVVRAIRDF